jgi:hypothetical protein
MLANTLTVTIDTVDKVLFRVNQDNFGSQYQLKTAAESFILKIRNSTEKSSGYGYDRHNVELSWLIYETDTTPEQHYTALCTFRCRAIGSDPAVSVDVMAGVNALVNSIATNMSNGES